MLIKSSLSLGVGTGMVLYSNGPPLVSKTTAFWVLGIAISIFFKFVQSDYSNQLMEKKRFVPTAPSLVFYSGDSSDGRTLGDCAAHPSRVGWDVSHQGELTYCRACNNSPFQSGHTAWLEAEMCGESMGMVIGGKLLLMKFPFQLIVFNILNCS